MWVDICRAGASDCLGMLGEETAKSAPTIIPEGNCGPNKLQIQVRSGKQTKGKIESWNNLPINIRKLEHEPTRTWEGFTVAWRDVEYPNLIV